LWVVELLKLRNKSFESRDTVSNFWGRRGKFGGFMMNFETFGIFEFLDFWEFEI
jgi:hypothetical protein